MKLFIFLMSFYIALSSTAHAEDWSKVFKTVSAGPLVKLDIEKSGVKVGGCTGVVVRYREVLTAAHCVPTDEFVATIDGKPLRLLRHGPQDLALIEYFSNKKPISLAFSNPTIGSPLAVIGFMLGYPDPSLAITNTLGFEKEKGFGFLRLPYGVFPGNSGGPVVNLNGQLVGIVNSAAIEFSFGWAYDIQEVKKFLDMDPYGREYTDRATEGETGLRRSESLDGLR